MNNQKATKSITYYIMNCVIGAILIIAGVLLALFYTVPQGVMPALPFVLGSYGLLALFTGLNGMNLIRILKKDNNLAKQMNDINDERAVSLEQKAKAATYDFTGFLFLAFILFLAVMQVHLAVLLVFIGITIIRMFVGLYLLRKYNKEM